MGESLPLEQMTIEEKLRLMERLWDNLIQDPETIPSPAWHEQVLKDREVMLCEGTDH